MQIGGKRPNWPDKLSRMAQPTNTDHRRIGAHEPGQVDLMDQVLTRPVMTDQTRR